MLNRTVLIIAHRLRFEFDLQRLTLINGVISQWLYMGGIVNDNKQNNSTVRTASKVVVISGGGIAESGTHEELLAAGGIYKKLVKRQLQ